MNSIEVSFSDIAGKPYLERDCVSRKEADELYDFLMKKLAFLDGVEVTQYDEGRILRREKPRPTA
jgi:hypothetical protein